jgi:transposase
MSYAPLTDCQWQVIAPFLNLQRPRKLDLRQVFDALLYITRTGVQWRNLPADFPAWSAVYYYFSIWSASGLLERLNQRLLALERLQTMKRKNPSVLALDAQSVRLAPRISNSRGIDGHKKINGRKRQIATDTRGRVHHVAVHSADQYDGKAAKKLLLDKLDKMPLLQKVFIDKGYRGSFADACAAIALKLEVPRRKKKIKGFAVEKKRWVVERTFAWFYSFRRLVIDYERLPKHHESFILLANMQMILNKIT